MLREVALGAVLVAFGCKSSAGSSDDPDLKVNNAPSKGSAGGFSASLGAELGMGSGGGTEGSSAPGSAAAPAAGSGSGSASGSVTALGSGSASGSVTASGSAAVSGSGAGSTASGIGTTASGSGTGSTASGTGTTASGSGTGPTASGNGNGTGSTATGTGSTATGTGSTASGGGTTGTTPGSSGAAPVAVSAEVAAIKLTLMPGWERDVGEGGTFSRFVSVERTGQSALFKFHYGYEDARAPQDRDAYKKFLTESQILHVLNDRQRGTAWLLEGKDGTGAQSFRMVVIYGGKRLVCWGSQYKDSSLGDVRDEVVIQARKICESISL